MKKKIAILGATGSIGKSTLDVVSRGGDSFEVVLLSAHSRRNELEKIKSGFPSASCVLTGEKDGKQKLLRAIEEVKPDLTLNGISGGAGLEPSAAAIEAGSDLALANKETIVMAAKIIFRMAKEKNVKIIPVDSEHSAIFHLLASYAGQNAVENGSANAACQDVISEIILTASGGPFRLLSLAEIEKVSAKDALSHPTWKMGQKITIDSASMANKGLEIIEACALFNLPVEKIKVVIHPQSIVHSMVRLCNGVIYAQLSKPDMRHPIHDALYWPSTAPCAFETLDFDSLTLEFTKPDTEKFPMLRLAREAAKLKGLYPCAYNAANEEAATAFLNGRIGFTDIPKITSRVMEADWSFDYGDLQDVLKADKEARLRAVSFMEKNIS